MPKVNGTRKERAAELLKRLTRGPSFGVLLGQSDAFTPEEASRQYKIWSQSWILEDLKALIPELKRAKKVNGGEECCHFQD